MAKQQTAPSLSKPHNVEIIGKVAQVLNERELVINIGRQDSVKAGDRFKVLSAASLDVRDPDTGEVLGSIEREKVRVKASQVFDNMTVCKTYRTHWIGNYDLSPLEQTVASFMPRTKVTDTLRADRNDLPRELTLEESIVKIGDPVALVPDSDVDE